MGLRSSKENPQFSSSRTASDVKKASSQTRPTFPSVPKRSKGATAVLSFTLLLLPPPETQDKKPSNGSASNPAPSLVLMPFADCVAAFLTDGSPHLALITEDGYRNKFLCLAPLAAHVPPFAAVDDDDDDDDDDDAITAKAQAKKTSALAFVRQEQPEWKDSLSAAASRYGRLGRPNPDDEASAFSAFATNMLFDGKSTCFGIVRNRSQLYLFRNADSITRRGERSVGPIDLCSFGVEECASILRHPTDSSVLITVGPCVNPYHATLSFLRLRQEKNSRTERILTLLYQTSIRIPCSGDPFNMVQLPDGRHILIAVRGYRANNNIAGNDRHQLTVFDAVSLCVNTEATSALERMLEKSDLSCQRWCCWPKEGALILLQGVTSPMRKVEVEGTTSDESVLGKVGLRWLVTIPTANDAARTWRAPSTAIDLQTGDFVQLDRAAKRIIRLRSIEDATGPSGEALSLNNVRAGRDDDGEILRIAYV